MNWETTGVGVIGIASLILTLYFRYRSSKFDLTRDEVHLQREVSKEETAEQEDKRKTAIKEWKEIVKEMKSRHQDSVAQLVTRYETELKDVKTELVALRSEHMECRETSARQESKIEQQDEEIKDLRMSMKEMRDFLKNYGYVATKKQEGEVELHGPKGSHIPEALEE